MRKFSTLFKHDLYNLIYSNGNLVVFLVFPTVIIMLMGFLFDNLYNTPLVSSYDFLWSDYDILYCNDGCNSPSECFSTKQHS